MVTRGKDFRRTYSAQLLFLPKYATIGDMVAAFANPATAGIGFVNPVKIAELGQLNRAEQMFVDCVTGKEKCAEDNSCEIGKARPKEPVYNGRNANVIRADMIRFFAWGGDESHRVQGNVIGLMGAFVPDVLDLNQVPSPYALILASCHFACSDTPVMMMHAEFRFLALTGALLKGGLLGNGARIESDVLMGGGFASDRKVLLRDAQIGGNVLCDGGEFNGQDYSLDAEGIRVKGNFTMGNGFVANGEVNLTSTEIGGNLDCRGGKFNNEERISIAADKIRVRGGVSMSNEFYAKGEVRMIDANIGGAMQCDGGEFINPQKAAFCADGMKVSGNVFMREPFFADGEVLLRNAIIGGNWYCGGGCFVNKGGKAITADNVQVTGGVLLRAGFIAEGVVWLPDATINGNLFCDKGVFRNETDMSLTIVRADIGGDVRCDGSNFIGYFNAGGVKIKGALGWKQIEGGGTMNLDSASVGVLDDDEESREKFHFILDGFSYARFTTPAGAKSRIEWLTRSPESDFSLQPFEQAAKVLFTMGHDIDARNILLEKEKLLTERGDMSSAMRFLRRWWGRLAGYGYQLRKTLAWSVGVIIAGTVVFNFADDACHIVPSQPAVVVSEKYMNAQTHKCAIEGEPTKATVRLFPEYSAFQPLAYSADVFFPFFALHQEPYWEPKPKEEFPVIPDISDVTDIPDVKDKVIEFAKGVALYFLRVWFWLEVAAGWLLTSLAVLSITGLLRPRQSSGDKE